MSIATDNETATIRAARVIFLILLGVVASDSMNFFVGVGFDETIIQNHVIVQYDVSLI